MAEMWSWLKPLVAIVRKALISAPQHLQHMLLRFQRYNLEIRYKRGKEMFLTDTLSRASHQMRKCLNLSMPWRRLIIRPSPVSGAWWHQIGSASADDPVLQELQLTIQRSWPRTRDDVFKCLYPCFCIHNKLTVQGTLIFNPLTPVPPVTARAKNSSISLCHP